MNNNLFIFVIAAALFAVGLSHPAYRKEFDKIVNSNDCLKSCMSNLTSFNEETSLMKNPNIQYYFGKIDGICEIISSTRECIDKCGIESNPFALDSVTVICSEEMREKVEKLGECLSSKTDIYKTCADSCGDYNAANDQVHQLTQSLKDSEVRDNGKVNPIMEKTNEACGIFKCVTKCNVETVKAECGKEDAEELQTILQKIFDTHHADLKKLNIVEQMSKTIPPQCNYMWDPTVIFSNSEISQNDNTNTAEILAKVQLELLVKQLKLVERQDDLITRENQKLDMEMDLLSQKFHKRHQPKSFEESQIMFS